MSTILKHTSNGFPPTVYVFWPWSMYDIPVLAGLSPLLPAMYRNISGLQPHGGGHKLALSQECITDAASASDTLKLYRLIWDFWPEFPLRIKKILIKKGMIPDHCWFQGKHKSSNYLVWTDGQCSGLQSELNNWIMYVPGIWHSAAHGVWS